MDDTAEIYQRAKYQAVHSRNSSGFSSLEDGRECERSTGLNVCYSTSDLSEKSKHEDTIARLQFELEAVKCRNKRMEMQMASEREQFRKEIEILKTSAIEYQDQLQKKNHECDELLGEIGRLEFEAEQEVNERKHEVLFQQIFSQNTAEVHMINPTYTERRCELESECSVSTEQPIDTVETLASATDEENVDVVTIIPPQIEPYSGHMHEQISPLPPQNEAYSNMALDDSNDEQQGDCFDNNEMETNGEMASSSANNDRSYRHLLEFIAQSLLFDDVVKLKDWASKRFSIDNSENVADVLLHLDQTGVIHASNLNELRDFFESIKRVDLVYIIDEFLHGNYI
ncbi:---NA--- [Paramuricea clavata]|uniref:---NA n=1 Tax=Paramuricea clavata TaxID=317549 RepID=A0A7D9LCD8_PARCT|nr:---NA--- [Paramuricea clavata]